MPSPVFGGDRRGRLPLCLASALAVALVGGLSGRAIGAPTPASGTLTPTGPSVNWTGGNIFGANTDESTCNEDLTCENFTLTLAPGNYTGKRVQVGILWLVPADDYDEYVHADTPSGAVVTSSTSGAPGTTERAFLSIDPPVVTTPRVY